MRRKEHFDEMLDEACLLISYVLDTILLHLQDKKRITK
jgi:hypothetical protein